MGSQGTPGEDLARSGLRATRQRVAVLRLLRRHRGHPTAMERHYHVHCRVCGLLLDAPANADGPIRGRASLPGGFRVEAIHVTLEGCCLRCQDEV
jgi:Fe2+ or Zn2+ uptake regulation protein